MPTTLPRSQVTHTPSVRHALEVAERRWPGERPGSLLIKLIEEGARSIETSPEALERQERVRALAGRYPGVYGTGYLEDVRSEWPE